MPYTCPIERFTTAGDVGQPHKPVSVLAAGVETIAPEHGQDRLQIGKGLASFFHRINPCWIVNVNIVEENVVLTRHVFDVVAHDFERRISAPCWRIGRAIDTRRFHIGWQIGTHPQHANGDCEDNNQCKK